MKGSGLVLLVFLAGLAAAGWRVWTVSCPGARSARHKIQILHSRKAGQNLLADRIETKNSVIYTTDPGLGRAMRKEDREEKQKQRDSWKMLQHMYLPARAGHGHSPAPSGAAPAQ